MTSFPLKAVALAITAGLASATVYAGQTQPLQGILDKTPNLIAITGATVHVAPGQQVANATLLINDGKVVSVSVAPVPAGYREVKAAGYHIYPGFIDPYSEYGLGHIKVSKGDSEKPIYSNKSVGANSTNAAVKPEIDWVKQFQVDEKAAKTYLEQGFTAVQSARFDGIFQGSALTVSLASGRSNDVVLNPHTRQFMSFDKGSSEQQYPSSLMGSIALIRQTLTDANWFEQAWGKEGQRYFHENVEFNSALAALTEVEQQGVIFNSSDDRDLMRAEKLMADFGVKASYVGSGFEYAQLSTIKAKNPQLILPLNFPKAPEVSQATDALDVSLADLRHWERAPANPALLAESGIEFAFTLHALKKPDQFLPNLRKAVKAGLSEQTALAALTTVPAKIAGVAEQLGQLKTGFDASFVMVKGDLFKDGKIQSVWTAGEQHEFAPLTPTTWQGDYALSIAGKEVTLALEGDDKVSGAVKAGEDKVKLDNVSADQEQLTFTVAMAKLGGSGVARVKAVVAKDGLTLTWLDANGSVTEVLAQRNSAAADDKKADVADKANRFVSKLTFPNKAFGPAAVPEQQGVHFKNATVWTATEQGILSNADVIIQAGKIVQVGQNLSTPSGFVVVDATGKHITPGIIDEHSHIAIDRGVNEGSDAVTSEVRIGDVLNPEDIDIYYGLAGGTTAAQLLHGSANPIGGQAQVIKLRWGQDAESLKFKAAEPSIKFALGENVKQSNWGDNFTVRYPQTRIGVDTVIRDAFQAAKEYKAAWQDYDALSRAKKAEVAPPRKDFRLQTLVEILDGQRHIHTHSYVASEILMLMKLATEMDFKVNTFTHILEGYKVADEMRAHGASASTFADWWAYKFEVYDAMAYNTCLMMKKGINVSVNSDSNDLHRRLNQEAAKSVKYCGISKEEAIKLVTINPAKQLKVDKVTGSLEAGKHADLVLWSADPLSVYAKAEQTYIDGRKYFDRERDAQLRQAQAQEKNALIQKVLGADDSDKAGQEGGYKQAQPTWHCDDLGQHAEFTLDQLVRD